MSRTRDLSYFLCSYKYVRVAGTILGDELNCEILLSSWGRAGYPGNLKSEPPESGPREAVWDWVRTSGRTSSRERVELALS